MNHYFGEIEFARELAEGGDLSGAMEILRPLAEGGADPEVGRDARLAMAYCCHAAGESVRAVELAYGLVRRYPRSPEAHVILGGILSDLGEYEGAEEALRRARDLEPKSGLVRYHLALLRYRMGRYHAALRDLARALSLGHDPVETEELRGEILLGLERYEEALEAFAKARARAPDRLDLCVETAAARSETGDLDGAWEDCMVALRRDADYAPAYLQMAQIRERQGRRAEALPLLRSAIQVEPEAPEPYHLLVRALFDLGRIDEAAAVLEDCRRRVCRRARGEDYAFLRAVLLERRQGAETALAYLRAYLRGQPARSWDLLAFYRRLAGFRAEQVPMWEVRVEGRLPDPVHGTRPFSRRIWVAAPSAEGAIAQVRDLIDPTVPPRYTVACKPAGRRALRELGPYQCGAYEPPPVARMPCGSRACGAGP